MAVRSRRLSNPIVLPTVATAIIVTVPPGRVAIVKSITLYNPNALASGVGFTIQYTGSGGELPLWGAVAAGNGGTLLLPYLVLNPGDTLKANATGANVRCTAYGSLLLGEPA